MSREIRSSNLPPPVSTAPSAAVHIRNKFWGCSYEEPYIPFFFFIGSWISGEVGTGDVSIGSDSSVDTSTTVSVITSGLMAAWINSGVDTQGGTKTSTMRDEKKKKKGSWWSFYLIILMSLIWNYFKQGICNSIARFCSSNLSPRKSIRFPKTCTLASIVRHKTSITPIFFRTKLNFKWNKLELNLWSLFWSPFPIL